MKTAKIVKRSLEYGLIRSSMELARILPRDRGIELFSAFGAVSANLFKESMNRAVHNLGIAFPRAPAPVRKGMARAMFKEIGKNCFDFIKLSGSSDERIRSFVDRIDGLEYFDEAVRRGRGVLSVTGHIGCWELMAACMRAHGYPVTVVARKLWLEKLNEKIIEMRRSVGVRTLDRDCNPRRMVEVLERGEVLGMLIDQNTRVGGIYVPFFDRPAHTPCGVAKLACMTGAAIVPMAIYLRRNKRHRIRILRPLQPEETAGSKEHRVEVLTRACSRAIEELIRFDPKQWIWFHDRWKSDKRAEIHYAQFN